MIKIAKLIIRFVSILNVNVRINLYLNPFITIINVYQIHWDIFVRLMMTVQAFYMLNAQNLKDVFVEMNIMKLITVHVSHFLDNIVGKMNDVQLIIQFVITMSINVNLIMYLYLKMNALNLQ
ncbi:uncharacterized protein LOC141527568 [Cotesia typhae]|uniref:uncharacterized protein LOC141527568 n=1 Tax=Cotesia typhae TaxID=2053667 RepID=UPI003D697D1D